MDVEEVVSIGDLWERDMQTRRRGRETKKLVKWAPELRNVLGIPNLCMNLRQLELFAAWWAPRAPIRPKPKDSNYRPPIPIDELKKEAGSRKLNSSQTVLFFFGFPVFPGQVAKWRFNMDFGDNSVNDAEVNKDAWAFRKLFNYVVRRWGDSDRPKPDCFV